MNILIFICGMGAGSLITILLLISCIRLGMARSKKWNQDTIDLMRERNKIAEQMLVLQQERIERGI